MPDFGDDQTTSGETKGTEPEASNVGKTRAAPCGSASSTMSEVIVVDPILVGPMDTSKKTRKQDGGQCGPVHGVNEEARRRTPCCAGGQPRLLCPRHRHVGRWQRSWPRCPIALGADHRSRRSIEAIEALWGEVAAHDSGIRETSLLSPSPQATTEHMCVFNRKVVGLAAKEMVVVAPKFYNHWLFAKSCADFKKCLPTSVVR